MSGGAVPRGTAEAPGALVYSYDAPQTIRSASLFLPGAKVMFRGPSVAPCWNPARMAPTGARGRYSGLRHASDCQLRARHRALVPLVLRRCRPRPAIWASPARAR
jgi:hypothetical protein